MKSNLKNNEKLLNVIGEVRDDLIPDQTAKAPNRALKITLSAMCGLCAAFAIVGVGMKVYSRIHNDLPAQTGTSIPVATDSGTQTAATTGSEAKTEQTVTETAAAENESLWKDFTAASCKPEKTGSEKIALYGKYFNNSVSESNTANYYGGPARSADIGTDTLPVFRNLGVSDIDPSLSSMFLSESQATELLKHAAQLLKIPETEILPEYWDAEQKNPHSYYMPNNAVSGGEISALRDGTVQADVLYEIGNEDPVEYAKRTFAALAGWTSAEAYISRTIDQTGTYDFIHVYEASNDPVQALLNDSLCYIDARLEDADTISSLTFSSPLIAAEYIGEYTVISAEEAKQQFLSFDLRNAGAQDYPPVADKLEGGKITDDMITRIELVYVYDAHEEFIAPYYRFWVRTDRDNNDHITSYEGIDYYYYTPFDIPAVRTDN